MSKLIVELPDDLHAKLKAQAASRHETLKAIVSSLLHQYLTRESPPVSSRKTTGLCGTWKDARSTQALIAEIHSSRRWSLKNRS